jgi:chromosome condensin MukBEF MukE localization factor
LRGSYFSADPEQRKMPAADNGLHAGKILRSAQNDNGAYLIGFQFNIGTFWDRLKRVRVILSEAKNLQGFFKILRYAQDDILRRSQDLHLPPIPEKMETE